MDILLIIVGMLMIVFTLLPLIRTNTWWVRIFDFPRLQIFVVSAFTLAALVLYKGDLVNEFILPFVLSLCVVYQGYMIYPYTFLSPRQVPSSNTKRGNAFSLLTANVLMENRDSVHLKALIDKNDPDIILVVETDLWWEEALRDYEHDYPYVIHRPQDDTYGMHLYSRLELINPEVRFLVQDYVPSICGRIRLPSGTETDFYCLHPPPPFPTEAESSAERDTELFLIANEIKKRNRPVIVLGDLNDVAWSRTNKIFQKISGLSDPRVGRGFYNTFHAKLPFIRFPLDHFFVSHHFSLLDFRRLPHFGSDHFPVYIALSDGAGDRV
ncbi:MAG: endonuclease/exonuclease/phosphatase family protein [Balneolales bacterium]